MADILKAESDTKVKQALSPAKAAAAAPVRPAAAPAAAAPSRKAVPSLAEIQARARHLPPLPTQLFRRGSLLFLFDHFSGMGVQRGRLASPPVCPGDPPADTGDQRLRPHGMGGWVGWREGVSQAEEERQRAVQLAASGGAAANSSSWANLASKAPPRSSYAAASGVAAGAGWAAKVGAGGTSPGGGGGGWGGAGGVGVLSSGALSSGGKSAGASPMDAGSSLPPSTRSLTHSLAPL